MHVRKQSYTTLKLKISFKVYVALLQTIIAYPFNTAKHIFIQILINIMQKKRNFKKEKEKKDFFLMFLLN